MKLKFVETKTEEEQANPVLDHHPTHAPNLRPLVCLLTLKELKHTWRRKTGGELGDVADTEDHTNGYDNANEPHIVDRRSEEPRKVIAERDEDLFALAAEADDAASGSVASFAV